MSERERYLDVSADEGDDEEGEDEQRAAKELMRRRKRVRDKHRIRYVFFDAECAQSRQLTLSSGSMVNKHECLLLVAEVICVPCIRAGITTEEKDDERMAPDCVCGLWKVDNPKRYGEGMEKQYRYSRRLLFENFQDERINPVWLFCQYLMTSIRYPRTRTIAISHNGGIFFV